MNNERPIDLLKQGPQIWNTWRDQHPDLRPTLHDEDLSTVLLRDADLHDLDLTQVLGLDPGQFGGANLARVQLPPTVRIHERLAEVDAVAQNGQTIVIALLLGCVYSWLTVATTSDVRLLTNSASSPLPLIRTEIPIVGFYLLAPLILLSMYGYCHVYLQRYWEGLAGLPAIFPDGRSLDKRTYPWLLSGVVQGYFPLLQQHQSLLAPLQVWLPVCVTWGMTPLTLVVVWGRYLARHDWGGTLLHAALLALVVGIGVFSYRLARATLRGCAVHRYERSRGALMVTGSVSGVTLLVFCCLSLGVMEGVPPADPFNPTPPNPLAQFVPQSLSFAGFHAFADFTGAEVSTMPRHMEDRGDATAFKDVKGASLRGRNLRYVLASHAFLVNADLRQADLRGANLAGADLRGAHLEEADLREANLLNANLQGANLQKANLWGAYLGQAHLEEALLNGASLGDTNLWQAKVRGAHLEETQAVDSPYLILEIPGADLQRAKLWETDFSGAQMQGVKFWQAEIYEVNFRAARLEHAQFQYAFLGKADFTQACFLGASVQGVDLHAIEGMTQKQFDFVVQDEKTVAPHFSHLDGEELEAVACEAKDAKVANRVVSSP